MKIALVAQHATPLHPSTAASPRPDDSGLTGLSRSLARQGNQVTVYTQQLDPGRDELGDGVLIEHVGGGDRDSVSLTDASLTDASLTDLPTFSDPLRARWLRERPDVVHAADWTSGLAALAATRGLGIPVVQAFSALGAAARRGHPDGGFEPARLRLEPAIGRSADAVVAASSAVASDLTRLGVPRKSVRCVPWGVDTDAFNPDGPAAERNGRPRLLTAADLSEREALQTLLRALTKVPGAELMIIGGPRRDRLVKDAAYKALAAFTGSLDLTDRVIFTGQVGRDAMPTLLRSADVVVSTCSYEPSGVTSLEAMACGKPVVAPPTGGHVDAVVDGTTGIIIPPGRPALLAQRIRHLLGHPILMEAYGVAGADRAMSRYTWDRIAAETIDVYDGALAA